MVQEVTMQQVASFQVFIRDNKPKMTVSYPFLSQEQIMCRLRQQWKKLDDPKRQPYSKLVLAKKKTVKTTKVKVVTVKKCRTHKGKQSRNSKCVDISRHNDSDENFGFDIRDDSYINGDYELDSTGANSPFVQNQSAVDSLNSDCSPGLCKPTESLKKGGRGKTYRASMFGVDCVSRITTESVDSSRTGMLQTPCKNRRNTQAHVSFSVVQETVHNLNGNESSDEDIDEEVLCIESSTKNKTDANTCRNKDTEEIVSHRTNLQQVEDRFLTLGFRDTPRLKHCFAAGELGATELKKQKFIVKTADKTTTVLSPECTPFRFSKRLRNLSPDDDVSGTVHGRSLHQNPTIHFNKKSKMVSEFYKQETFSIRNNTTSVDKRGPIFTSESRDLSAEVTLQSCLHENRTVLPEKLHGSRYIDGSAENVKPEIKLNNELKNKADVNRKHFSEKSGPSMLDCSTNKYVTRFSSRVAAYSHNLRGFGSPQATNSCVRSTEHTSDSYYQEGLKTSSVKISQKVYSDFSGKSPYRKKGDRFRENVEESDGEFGDRGCFLKNNTVRKALCHTDKKKASADETHLKTHIRKKSESLNTDSLQRESIILGKKVDSSDEKDEIEFDDNDGCDKDNNQFTDDGSDKNDTVPPGTYETEKKTSSVVGAYLKKVDNSRKEVDDGVSDKVNTVSTQPHQTRKEMNSAVGAYLKTVDNSDEIDNEFDDDDNDKDDTVPTGQRQTRKEMNSAVGAYLKTVDNSDEIDSEFDDDNDKDDTVPTGQRQTRKEMNSTVGVYLKKVDNSDEETDNEFDDDDDKDDTVPTGQRQTRKKMNSAVGAFLKKSTRKKCDFDLHGQERDINRKGVDRRDEDNNKNTSLLKNNIYNNGLCYLNKQNTFQTYSKRGTLNEAGKRSFHSSGKGTYNHSQDTDKNLECDKEFDSVVSSYKNDAVKSVPCITSRNTSRRNNHLPSHKGNNDYQANRIIDPLGMYTNNSTQKNSRDSKDKGLDKREHLKHVAGARNKMKQVSENISGKEKPRMSTGGVEHKYFKTENGVFRKYPKSGRKQTSKPKGKDQKKSAVDQKRNRSLNQVEEIRNNNVKWLNAFTSDNFGGNRSCILPVSLGNGIIHHKSHLNNSSKKQEKHMQEFCGHQSPPCKETPNLDVRKLKHTSGLNRGSGIGLQRRLFPDVDCRNTSNIDCRINRKMDCRNKTSNTDYRMNRKMDCKHISTTDHTNKSQVSGKAKDECKSDAESDTSGNSLGSETDEDEGKTQDDFLISIADQTTSALLQAIDRLKSLTSPQMVQTDQCLPDGGPPGLPQPEDKAQASTQPQFLCSMFQDITHSASRAYLTPAKHRLLTSSVTETPSNFMMMFDENDIFL